MTTTSARTVAATLRGGLWPGRVIQVPLGARRVFIPTPGDEAGVLGVFCDVHWEDAGPVVIWPADAA